MHAAPLPVVGLDVSKATVAACYQRGTHLHHVEVSNDSAGFTHLLQDCGAACLFVLEATGTYYLALAYHLHEQGGQVAVVNPLVIKRFIQMHLGKGKTDRQDAQWLLRYGQQQAVKCWQPEEALLVECRQLEQVTEQLLKQKTMVANSLEALQHQPVISPLAQQRLQQTWQLLDDQVRALEAELLALLDQRFAQEMKLLCSIPGISRKTAGMLLLFAGGFVRLDNYRQLIAKAGLSPREYTSGTSIRGKTRITKMGGALLRSKLFVCSFSAKRSNAACKALYERLVAKGKNGKVALIAVCNKLLKQAFAIVKSGVPYQANFTKLAA
ncbi:IS110 family transposase [Hymenobacter cheonanensis]|uniref:IS110 family transposase n=1 Tax=Hymenobacter sp. CA2-7 TaxID=3063993 RepID=UPI0027127919|nr:IS110 family transposase [Hymenobacter sp. CA2-7]MDO7888144.1 IS110 family transposase [Hymenobacter sp. CA2-7]